MPLRHAMAGQLRARRLARGWSLEQLGRRAGIIRTSIHATETGVTGDHLDRLETIAAALDAHWEVSLVPNEATGPLPVLLEEVARLPEPAAAELLDVVRAWGALSDDDRSLVRHLAERCLARTRAASEATTTNGAHDNKRAV